MRELFFASFYRFKDLKKARFLGFGKVVLYVLLLSLFLTIPVTKHVLAIFHDIQSDGQKIAQKLPDFTIENGTLTPKNDEEGFIYQTDSIIFTFDPEGKREVKNISNDLMGNFLSIGLLPTELVVALPSSGITTQVFGSNLLEFPYKNGLTTLDGAHIRDYLSEQRLPWWMFALTFLVSLYPAFINLLTTLLITAIGASIMSGLKRVKISFLENLKILVFCSTLPVILSALVELFTLNFDGSFFIILATLFIYNQATNGLPKKENQV